MRFSLCVPPLMLGVMMAASGVAHGESSGRSDDVSPVFRLETRLGARPHGDHPETVPKAGTSVIRRSPELIRSRDENIDDRSGALRVAESTGMDGSRDRFPASVTLSSAVTRAVGYFPQVRSEIANRRAIGETVNQARAQYFPSVDATLGQGPERSNNISTRATGGETTLQRTETELTVSQLLFDTGATSTLLKRQEARADGANKQVANTAETVGFRAAQAYLEVQRLRALVAVAGQNVAAHDRTLSQVTMLVEAGAGRSSDARQTAARLALARSSVIQLQGQLDQGEAAYRHLVGQLPGALDRVTIPVEQLPGAYRQASEDAVASHPAVRAAELDLEAANADRENARSRLGPRITLELGMTQNRDLDGVRGLSADRTAVVRLRQNLYRGGSDDARIRETEARRDEAQAFLDRAKNDVERDVRQAWDNLAADRDRLPQLRLHAQASAEVLEAYKLQFQLGQRSLLDVLNAENELFTSRSNELSGEYSLLTSAFKMLSSMGKLLPALGVTIPGDAVAEGAK